MKKSVLEQFINKYYLNGAAESVMLKSEKSVTSVNFVTGDRNAVGFISTKELDIPDGEYAIYDTKQLRGLLGVLDDDITIKVVSDKTKNTALTFSDSHNTKTTFVLSIEENIKQAPATKKEPAFDVVADIDKLFMERFIKASSALADVETFTVVGDGSATEVVIGYSNKNTNRVALPLKTSVANKIDPINFHAKYLKDILAANREASKGKLEVSSLGLAKVTFELESFTATYYLPMMTAEE